MRPANPRLKPSRRTRTRLIPKGASDLPKAKAIEVFQRRTGIDPTTNAELRVLLIAVVGGLDENRKGQQYVTVEGPADFVRVYAKARGDLG